MEERIKTIIEEFDFERVHNVMKLIKWEWLVPGGGFRVPYLFELQQQAYNMLREVSTKRDKKYWAISTGGFTAVICEGELSLRFELESYSEC